eukprot:scaffold82298_cov45-Cyclotella_meneghiniana.AAC.14
MMPVPPGLRFSSQSEEYSCSWPRLTSTAKSFAHPSPLEMAKNKTTIWPHRHKSSAAASKSPSNQPPAARFSRIPSSAIAAAIWWHEIRLIVVYSPFLSSTST